MRNVNADKANKWDTGGSWRPRHAAAGKACCVGAYRSEASEIGGDMTPSISVRTESTAQSRQSTGRPQMAFTKSPGSFPTMAAICDIASRVRVNRANAW
jgi:hypothetical protein